MVLCYCISNGRVTSSFCECETSQSLSDQDEMSQFTCSSHGSKCVWENNRFTASKVATVLIIFKIVRREKTAHRRPWEKSLALRWISSFLLLEQIDAVYTTHGQGSTLSQAYPNTLQTIWDPLQCSKWLIMGPGPPDQRYFDRLASDFWTDGTITPFPKTIISPPRRGQPVKLFSISVKPWYFFHIFHNPSLSLSLSPLPLLTVTIQAGNIYLHGLAFWQPVRRACAWSDFSG